MYPLHLIFSLLVASSLSTLSWAQAGGSLPPLPGAPGAGGNQGSFNPAAPLTGGMSGVRFVQAPIPIDDLNCSSVIVQGNAGFENRFFVLPRGFLAIDRSGNNYLKVSPQEDAKKPWSSENPGHLEFALFFPTDVNGFITARAGNADSKGCNFKKIADNLNKEFWDHLPLDPGKEKQYEPIKKKMEHDKNFTPVIRLLPGQPYFVRISFPTIKDMGVATIGKENETSALALYNLNQAVDIPINSPVAYNRFLNIFNDPNGLGVPVQLDIKFEASRSAGEMHCNFNSDKIESNLKSNLEARLGVPNLTPASLIPMGRVNLRAEIGKSVSNSSEDCTIDGGSDAFNQMAATLVQAISAEFTPEITQLQNQMQPGGLGAPPNIFNNPIGGIPGVINNPGSGCQLGIPPAQMSNCPCLDPQTGQVIAKIEFEAKVPGSTCNDGSSMDPSKTSIKLSSIMSRIKTQMNKRSGIAFNAPAQPEVLTTYAFLKGHIKRPGGALDVASKPAFMTGDHGSDTGVTMIPGRWVHIVPENRRYFHYNYKSDPTPRQATEADVLRLQSEGVNFGLSVLMAKDKDIVWQSLSRYQNQSNGDTENRYPTYPLDPLGRLLNKNLGLGGGGYLEYWIVDRQQRPEIWDDQLQPTPKTSSKGAGLAFAFTNGTSKDLYNVQDLIDQADKTKSKTLDDFEYKRVSENGEWALEIRPAAGKNLGSLMLYNIDKHPCYDDFAKGGQVWDHCPRTWLTRVYVRHTGGGFMGGNVAVPGFSTNCQDFMRLHPEVVSCPALNGDMYTDWINAGGYLKSLDNNQYLHYLEASSSSIRVRVISNDLPEDNKGPQSCVPDTQGGMVPVPVNLLAPSGGSSPAVITTGQPIPTDNTTLPMVPPPLAPGSNP